jgi:hypothetical protein
MPQLVDVHVDNFAGGLGHVCTPNGCGAYRV